MNVTKNVNFLSMTGTKASAQDLAISTGKPVVRHAVGDGGVHLSNGKFLPTRLTYGVDLAAGLHEAGCDQAAREVVIAWHCPDPAAWLKIQNAPLAAALFPTNQ